MFKLCFALAADRNVIPGVHVTLGSLLRHLSEECDAEFHLFHSGWRARDIACLEGTLGMSTHKPNLFTHELALEDFRGLCPVRGSLMNFAWFIIPNLLDGRVILLDTDLVVNKDVAPLAQLSLSEERFVAAVSWQCLGASVNWRFYKQFSLNEDAPAYIGGMYVVDTYLWKQRALSQACFELRRRYQHELIGGIDPILNVVARPYYLPLERSYNTPLWPSQGKLPSSTLAEPRVWHFAARPKPWEFLGELVSPNSELYLAALDATMIARYRSWQSPSPRWFYCMVRFSRAYLAGIKRAFRKAHF